MALFVAMQVLGLTNYSHWPEAAIVRACSQQSSAAQELLTSLAISKLREFTHVGLMERLDDSVAALAVSWTQHILCSSAAVHVMVAYCKRIS